MISSITMYSFARSSGHHQCLTNVTITVKVAMVTYIRCENGSQNLMSEAYLET